MNKQGIDQRLENGEVLLLDGGTGSELQRRGVDISKRTSDGEMGAWSATANIDAPDIVREIHRDFLQAGSDIITTNSFWSNRTRLDRIGHGDRMEEYTRISVELAREAVDDIGSSAYIAGSIAPPVGRPKPGNNVRNSEDMYVEFRDQAGVLADAGADMILLEYVSSTEETEVLTKAAISTGLPVLLGLKHFDGKGTLRSKENVVSAVRCVSNLPVTAILDMCSPPEEITSVLPLLREEFDGPLGAYANIGYSQDPTARTDETIQWHRIEIGDNIPDQYAKVTLDWIDKGAQIVGGCCAATPDHISVIRSLISSSSH